MVEGYKERLGEELGQLEERLMKLRTFLKTNTYRQLSKYDQKLLFRQYKYMTKYSFILIERINREV